MVPAAGADCASWISENIVERSGGSSAGSRPFPPPMSPAVHGLWVRMMTARWRGSQASRMRCGTSRTSSSPISAIVVTPREMGDVTALPLSPPASRIVAEDSDLVPRLAGVGDDCELVITSPTDASPAIECLSPELALPITASGWQPL